MVEHTLIIEMGNLCSHDSQIIIIHVSVGKPISEETSMLHRYMEN